MTKRKYDVRLNYSWCSTIEPVYCGSLIKKQIDQYLQELSTKGRISKDSCVRHLTAQFDKKESANVSLYSNSNSDAPSTHKSGSLNLHISVVHNRKCNYRDCINNIRDGKCTDPFIIENIGKKFFAEKYQDKQK